MIHWGYLTLAILLTGLLFATVAQGKPTTRTITLKEQLNQKYGPELLSYPFTADRGACVAESVRLSGPHGPVPVQLSEIAYWPGKRHAVKTARLLFIADALQPLSSDVYTLSYDGKADSHSVPASATELQIHSENGMVELTTDQVGIRLPNGGASFTTPVRCMEVPGPLTAMRLGHGAWGGGSALTGDMHVTAWTGELLDAGPVQARVHLRYTFADGNTLTLIAALAAGDSAVRWTMAVEKDHPDLGVDFRLPPVPGVREAVLPRGYGQWAQNRTQPLSPSDTPFSALTPDTSLANIFQDNAPTIRLKGEAGAELFLASRDPGAWVDPVAPLTYAGFNIWQGDTIPKMWDVWKRKAMAVSYAGDGTVTMRASLAAGQRVWLTGAGAPAVGDTLNRVKDMVLDWPADAHKPHPHLFMDAQAMRAAWQRAAGDPALMRLLNAPEQRWAWDDLAAPAAIGVPYKPAAALAEKDKAVGFLREQLALLGNFDVMRGAIAVAGLYDALIDSDLLSPRDKALFRAQMAYLAYVMADPRCWSMERGYLSGNPNMSCSYTLSLGIIACALDDHPLAKQWAGYAAAWAGQVVARRGGPQRGVDSRRLALWHGEHGYDGVIRHCRQTGGVW